MEIIKPIGPLPKYHDGGRVTLYDVARESGVTYTTVSNVINGKGRVSETTRAAVLKAVTELDYQINPHAQRLAEGIDKRTVALVALFVDFDVVMRKIQAIQATLQSRGYSAPLHAYGLSAPSEADELKFISEVRRQRPRAIICYSQRLNAQSWDQLRAYQREGGHVVFFDQPCEEPFDRVLFDRAHNTFEAAHHLLTLGHRKVGFWMSSSPRGSRLEGFEKAMRQWKAPIREEWLFRGGSYKCNEESGFKLAAQFLSLKDRPTSICIVNDSTAHAFVAALHRAGVRVPEDVSVVGHDDTPIAQFGFLPLTTVSHPTQAIAEAVVALLDKGLEGRDDSPVQVQVRGELVVRQSTAPPSSRN